MRIGDAIAAVAFFACITTLFGGIAYMDHQEKMAKIQQAKCEATK